MNTLNTGHNSMRTQTAAERAARDRRYAQRAKEWADAERAYRLRREAREAARRAAEEARP